jgi:hypothetical protein
MPHPRNLILGHKLKRVKLEAMAIDGFHCRSRMVTPVLP